jgi:hypothetical protein
MDTQRLSITCLERSERSCLELRIMVRLLSLSLPLFEMIFANNTRQPTQLANRLGSSSPGSLSPASPSLSFSSLYEGMRPVRLLRMRRPGRASPTTIVIGLLDNSKYEVRWTRRRRSWSTTRPPGCSSPFSQLPLSPLASVFVLDMLHSFRSYLCFYFSLPHMASTLLLVALLDSVLLTCILKKLLYSPTSSIYMISYYT